jgi:hypothetical protein
VEAGIQMDSMIARKIWRSIVVTESETNETYMVGQVDHSKVPVPAFSTDQDTAYKVVEYFQSHGWTFRIQHIAEDDIYRASFFKEDSRQYRFESAKTVPMAICKAGLAVNDGSNIVK